LFYAGLIGHDIAKIFQEFKKSKKFKKEKNSGEEQI